MELLYSRKPVMKCVFQLCRKQSKTNRSKVYIESFPQDGVARILILEEIKIV